MQARPVVEVAELRKSYGSVLAVDGISFRVKQGEIFGMVGPNGAGKTTTIECIEGLRQPDGGTIRVLGRDPRRDAAALRPVTGAQLQESALQDRIRVWEALDLFASFYPSAGRLDHLLDRLGLAEARNTSFAKLSGGQKQRLFVALALVNDPELVFLDELTTGLDPQARRGVWELIAEMRNRGKTVFLTTHFMEEAERLCDRVAILDHGRIVALDAPAELVRGLGAESSIVFTADPAFDPEGLRRLPAVTRVEVIGDRVIASGREETLVVEVVNALSAAGCRIRDLRTEQPTLEDVFLSLTGRGIRE
ncbi:MAG: ATP-binding cassette domain-containing protein [Armatimonadota bacterium]